ncbi:MAG: ImmA/IrrE family metallo-endopeptidase [Gammaproteobacteria bacterium]|nr:ImmA/IrrE family metallo-endopeptidase [Gammaproteobacteria bacterium]
MVHLSPAEQLLQELGVIQPQEIDLEAIAWHLGVQIRYRHLEGCEARIAGDNKRAIISVRDDVSPGRKRFSIAHELGHWQYHRGRILICRPEDIGQETPGKPATEQVADKYAADMLMPQYLFLPEAQKHRKLTWDVVRGVADIFSSSITATAIRIIDLDLFPALLVCHGISGRRWFRRAKSVPERWFPRNELSHDSYAFDVLYGRRGDHPPTLMDADAWFDRYDASRYQLNEQSVKISNDVLTLLLPKDEMLDEVDTHRPWGRYR